MKSKSCPPLTTEAHAKKQECGREFPKWKRWDAPPMLSANVTAPAAISITPRWSKCRPIGFTKAKERVIAS